MQHKLVKNQSRVKKEFHLELTSAFTKFRSNAQVDRFLHDLLTPAEYDELSLRLQIVKLLHRGLTIRDVSMRLGVALATVVRGARELKYSKLRGFHELLK